jgi:hypothetical protein
VDCVAGVRNFGGVSIFKVDEFGDFSVGMDSGRSTTSIIIFTRSHFYQGLYRDDCSP